MKIFEKTKESKFQENNKRNFTRRNFLFRCPTFSLAFLVFFHDIITRSIRKLNKFHILVVNCESLLFSKLYDFVTTYFNRVKAPYIITKRKYNELSDIIKKLKEFDLIVISGSYKFFPDSPEMQDVRTLLKILMKQNKHGFLICFGMQLLAYLLDSEKGKLIKKGSWDKDVAIEILKDDPIFKNIGKQGDSFITREYHNYSVPFLKKKKLGKGIILAKSKDGIEIIRVGNIVATQFHPESQYASNAAKKVFYNYLQEFILNYKKSRSSD